MDCYLFAYLALAFALALHDIAIPAAWIGISIVSWSVLWLPCRDGLVGHWSLVIMVMRRQHSMALLRRMMKKFKTK